MVRYSLSLLEILEMSAAGGILNSRNPAYQAVYTVMGVTDNVHDLSLTQLLQKKMFNELITILGTGIGKNFDITKLRYDKIIICTDSDVDGFNITSLLLCFFFIFMPDLISEGKLYKAMPPPDGVKGGFDIEMLQSVSDAVSVPVIASGGAGCIDHFTELFRALPKVDAGLAASIFHFGEVKIEDLKKELDRCGIPVRL